MERLRKREFLYILGINNLISNVSSSSWLALLDNSLTRSYAILSLSVFLYLSIALFHNLSAFIELRPRIHLDVSFSILLYNVHCILSTHNLNSVFFVLLQLYKCLSYLYVGYSLVQRLIGCATVCTRV